MKTLILFVLSSAFLVYGLFFVYGSYDRAMIFVKIAFVGYIYTLLYAIIKKILK
jgi:hypothetical protein